MSVNVKKYCVLGHNIAYSLSPKLHGIFFEVLRENAEYSVCDVEPQELENTVKRLLRDFDGFNVTKPYKESVARILGGTQPVNTVKRDGTFTSTDAAGFITDYIELFGEPCGNVLLLGAGGAAKSVASALGGYSECNVYVYNRTYGKAKELSELCGATALKSPIGKFDSVINCTSLGLCGEQAAPDELDLKGVKFAYDLIYSPPITPFIEKARAAGAKTACGIGMLIHQAIAAQEFWRGEKFAETQKTKLYNAAKEKIIQGSEV